jgi:hypothetical protein
VRLWAAEEPQRFVVGADVAVSRAGRPVATLTPRLNFYQMRDEPIPTPARAQPDDGPVPEPDGLRARRLDARRSRS